MGIRFLVRKVFLTWKAVWEGAKGAVFLFISFWGFFFCRFIL